MRNAFEPFWRRRNVDCASGFVLDLGHHSSPSGSPRIALLRSSAVSRRGGVHAIGGGPLWTLSVSVVSLLPGGVILVPMPASSSGDQQHVYTIARNVSLPADIRCLSPGGMGAALPIRLSAFVQLSLREVAIFIIRRKVPHFPGKLSQNAGPILLSREGAGG